ncbi:hypothetical protein B7P43_G18396 [Cryptotermes secundus]|uniref:Uncharacterized protein n=1 Tax=Cryptotermes secundus TaxID=105785 RepID=A0A2J7QGC0_9NEOP|nr:hypothetical protein B7P43_G18396 [Cryptotermes secundus]
MQLHCAHLSQYEFTQSFDVIDLIRMALSPLHHSAPSDGNVDYAGPIDKM